MVEISLSSNSGVENSVPHITLLDIPFLICILNAHDKIFSPFGGKILDEIRYDLFFQISAYQK